jgi:flavin-binding protein dodecin
MTEWDDRLENHSVHTSVQKLLNLVGKSKKQAEDAVAVESLARIEDAARHIKNLLGETDAHLVAESTLNNLHNQLNQAANQINSFTGNGNVGHLNNANNHIDNALPQASLLPSVEGVRDVVEIRRSVSSFRKSAGQHLRYLEEDVERRKSELNELQQAIDQRKKEIENQKGRLDTAIQEFVQNSSTAIEEAKAKLETSVRENQQAIEEYLTKARSKVDQLNEDVQEQAEAITSGLEALREDAKEIVGVISRTTMAGAYQILADEEKKTADYWRKIAVYGLIGIIAVAVITLFGFGEDGLTTNEFLARAFASLTFGLLAAFAGREAGFHRRREQRNRRLQLELSSIDAYLDSLPKEERDTIKAALADRLFGQPEPMKKGDEAQATAPSLLDLIKLLRSSQ